MPMPRRRPNSSGAFIAATNPRQPYTAKRPITIAAPMKPSFLANHRENEVRMRFRQEEQLLAAFHQADAGKSARSHRDERLQPAGNRGPADRLRARKTSARAAAGTARGRIAKVDQRQSGSTAASNIPARETRDEKHHEGDQKDHAGRAQVRLFVTTNPTISRTVPKHRQQRPRQMVHSHACAARGDFRETTPDKKSPRASQAPMAAS